MANYPLVFNSEKAHWTVLQSGVNLDGILKLVLVKNPVKGVIQERQDVVFRLQVSICQNLRSLVPF